MLPSFPCSPTESGVLDQLSRNNNSVNTPRDVMGLNELKPTKPNLSFLFSNKRLDDKCDYLKGSW